MIYIVAEKRRMSMDSHKLIHGVGSEDRGAACVLLRRPGNPSHERVNSPHFHQGRRQAAVPSASMGFSLHPPSSRSTLFTPSLSKYKSSKEAAEEPGQVRWVSRAGEVGMEGFRGRCSWRPSKESDCGGCKGKAKKKLQMCCSRGLCLCFYPGIL